MPCHCESTHAVGIRSKNFGGGRGPSLSALSKPWRRAMNVVIVGTGYVGLVSGVCLAAKGHRVICVDKNPLVVDALNAGEPHIFETGLPELLRQVRAEGLFSATVDLHGAMDRAELVIVAVGTPSKA